MGIPAKAPPGLEADGNPVRRCGIVGHVPTPAVQGVRPPKTGENVVVSEPVEEILSVVAGKMVLDFGAAETLDTPQLVALGMPATALSSIETYLNAF